MAARQRDGQIAIGACTTGHVYDSAAPDGLRLQVVPAERELWSGNL